VTPQRRAIDEVDIGELVRNLAALTSAVERINDKLDNLSTQFTPREVHDLALGGVKIDIRRIDEQSTQAAADLRAAVAELDRRQDDQHRETAEQLAAAERKTADRFAAAAEESARRFRQLVYAIAIGVLAPLTVGVVLMVLTSLPGSAS
jgi:CHASE3 domain sensor protein